MSWMNDPYWVSALRQLARLSHEHKRILVPNDWAMLDSRYLPVDYGWALPPEEITAFAIPKDDVDHLPYSLVERRFSGMTCIYANEVFVIYSSAYDDLRICDHEKIKKHLPYLDERISLFLNGQLLRPQAINPRYSYPSGGGAPILIVNASNMGNFGDELLAETVVKYLEQENRPYIVVRPDFVPSPNSGLGGIILAGGGVIYDYTIRCEESYSDLANVCNYFKYAFIADALNIPFHAIGIGDQHRFGGFVSIDATWYVRQAIRCKTTKVIYTRDKWTAARLTELVGEQGSAKIKAALDLAFFHPSLLNALSDASHSGVSVDAGSPDKAVAFVGQVFNQPSWARLVDKIASESWLVIFISQANEDPPHYQELRRRHPHLNITHIDLRDERVQAGLDKFKGIGCVITTRFHSLVVALCYGIPAVALCARGDKKDRLIDENQLDVPRLYVDSDADVVSHIYSYVSEAYSYRKNKNREAMRRLVSDYLPIFVSVINYQAQDNCCNDPKRGLLFVGHEQMTRIPFNQSRRTLMKKTCDEWLKRFDVKLDRLLNEIEFIKNRTTTYLGRNEALTYLADETPIFVNTDDFGCPINFMNGGQYEEDYFRVFLSFRKPDLPMLDIGANLGVYSLRMASYMRRGRIYAFEPIPGIRSLFSRSAFLNGFLDRITISPYAVSDREGTAILNVPGEHAGGASLEGAGDGGISVDVKRLDDLMPENFTCGLVKLDVEGHELHALRGMRNILARSTNSMVMFEKLAANSGIERDLYEYFEQLAWSVYVIDGRKLRKVDLSTFVETGGYFVASLPSVVNEEGLSRDFFHIYPSDLNVIEGYVNSGILQIDNQISAGSVVFHGPYWWLPRGYYRLTINGKVYSAFTLDICERFGYKTDVLELGPDNLTAEFPVARDLIKFELVMRPISNAKFLANINSIKLERIG